MAKNQKKYTQEFKQQLACQDFEECRKALFEYIESWYIKLFVQAVKGIGRVGTTRFIWAAIDK